MIKWFKIGNLIYQNIEPKTIDPETGTEIWNIPTDPDQLKQCCIDTLGWLVARKLNTTLAADKEKASTTKGIVLLSKIVKQILDYLNFTPNLTPDEEVAFQKIYNLTTLGYSSSQLLQYSSELLYNALQWYNAKMTELQSLNTLDELISFLENLDEP